MIDHQSGLYLTDLLVKLMNGSIAVSSDGTRGSTFRVHVMLRLLADTPVPRDDATDVLRGKRALIIASSATNRNTIAKLLESVSATIVCCSGMNSSAAEALPTTVTIDLLERTDLAVVELPLVPALQALQSRRISKAPLLIMPLANSLQ